MKATLLSAKRPYVSVGTPNLGVERWRRLSVGVWSGLGGVGGC